MYPSFMPQSYGENAMKMMQRSFSSNSFEGRPSNFSPFQPQLDTLLESPNLHAQVLSSPENSSFSSGQMRRVCSTGDLQVINKMKSRNTLSSSPLSRESSFMEEANFKVGRYSAEERKERIHRYRTKRNQRNFNKTIKYACRKTLADNRPRIRGRFARNDEAGDIPKTANFNRFEDEDDLWVIYSPSTFSIFILML
nr:zinc finger protein CONSTANS-like [Ipomoea batatas]